MNNSKNKSLNQISIDQLTEIVGKDNISIDENVLISYGKDYTEDLSFPPQVLLFPENTKQVSEIMKWCNTQKVPIVPRGAGTGLSGGSLPVQGGISISMEKMNKILSIDIKNFQATVEPGVINENFRAAVLEQGLFYPPDPASKGSCTLGGNVAHNSGGPRAVKYGVTSDYILNLEVVLPTGDIIWTGANTLKYSTGYNLTKLMLNSEGTLGIITKIVTKLIVKPKHDILLLASFESVFEAAEAVATIMANGLMPSALELMEKKGLEIAAKYANITFDFEEKAQAYLLIEFDGNSPEILETEIAQTYDILEEINVLNVLLADNSETKEKFWKLRRIIGEAVKQNSIYKEEDTVVPRYFLPELLKGVKEIGEEIGFESVCYGHAGDGNLHVNILKNNMSDEEWNGEKLENGIRQIFRLCKKLGGTISGEHGIGYVQKKYMNELFPQHHIELMKSIKTLFDPNHVLNPGKIFE